LQVYCAISPPFAVEALTTSTQSPECRAARVTAPFAAVPSSSRHSWEPLPANVCSVAAAPSAPPVRYRLVFAVDWSR
jgi:hypothetical protein